MTSTGFPITIDFERLLRTLSKEIYDTPMAFLRENVQNAVDAVRMRQAENPSFSEGRVTVSVDEKLVTITDNGVGMSSKDQQELFWRIGASGKNTPEARRAGCIGTFGIGGFANFGVCNRLVVTSKREGYPGCRTSLQRSDFGESTPTVTTEPSEDSGPHGTIVEAELINPGDPQQLKDYLKSFVRYVPELVTFNEENISGAQFMSEENIGALQTLMAEPVQLSLSHDSRIQARFYSDDAGTIHVIIGEPGASGVHDRCRGWLRLINGTLEALKKGFKLCNTSVPSHIGISGRLDMIDFVPTAGRDSLSPESQQLLSTLAKAIERQAIEIILDSTDLLSQHTRILRQVVAEGLIERLGRLDINLADGTKTTLGELRTRHESGTSIYFGSQVQRELLDVLQASGNVIVILSSEVNRKRAETDYLSSFCGATSYEGLVEIKEKYDDLSSFELDFLANLEAVIKFRYEVTEFTLIPARITGGVPAYVQGRKGSQTRIYVDVRHQEITRLHTLEGSSFLYSIVNEFCKEYLANALRAKSPKFFGSGSLDFDELIRKRAELWKLAESDILTFVRESEGGAVEPDTLGKSRNLTGIRDVLSQSDVATVEVGMEKPEQVQGDQGENDLSKGAGAPKILKLVDKSGLLGIAGFYIKLMDGPAKAFGDDIQAMEESSAFWFGNRITYAFTDAKNIVFHYELRLQQIILVQSGTERDEPTGVVQLKNIIQEYQGSMYFRIPEILERYLVPTAGIEILVRVNYDWFDLQRGKAWLW